MLIEKVIIVFVHIKGDFFIHKIENIIKFRKELYKITKLQSYVKINLLWN
jgi:hypothetical protein